MGPFMDPLILRKDVVGLGQVDTPPENVAREDRVDEESASGAPNLSSARENAPQRQYDLGRVVNARRDVGHVGPTLREFVVRAAT